MPGISQKEADHSDHDPTLKVNLFLTPEALFLTPEALFLTPEALFLTPEFRFLTLEAQFNPRVWLVNPPSSDQETPQELPGVWLINPRMSTEFTGVDGIACKRLGDIFWGSLGLCWDALSVFKDIFIGDKRRFKTYVKNQQDEFK